MFKKIIQLVTQKRSEKLEMVSQNYLEKLSQDINKVLWFKNGINKNYTSQKEEINRDRIGDKNIDEIIENIVNNIMLGFKTEEPSLIDVNEYVMSNYKIEKIDKLEYFPKYNSLTPEQKAVYLKFLENPFDSKFEIGYVFLFYYGLERHLLLGNFEDAFHFILKLRSIHRNASFLHYSAQAVCLMCIFHKKTDKLILFLKSLKEDDTLSFNIFMLCKYIFEQPLSAVEIKKYAKNFGFVANRGYIKDYPEYFLEELTKNMNESYGGEVLFIHEMIKEKEFENLNKVEISPFANISLEQTVTIPFFENCEQIIKPLEKLLKDTNSSLKIRMSEMRKNGEIKKQDKLQERKPIKNIPVFDSSEEKRILKKQDDCKNAIDFHFLYQELHTFYYKFRIASDEYIEKCIYWCNKDIENLDKLTEQYRKEELKERKFAINELGEDPKEQKSIAEINESIFYGRISAFDRLIIIYEKSKDYDKAITVCNSALNYHVDTETKQNYCDKITKLEKKIKKD